MPVKPLTFKGDKSRPKKRKHRETEPSTAPGELAQISTSKSTSVAQQTITEEDDSWVHPDHATDLSGPVILVLPTHPPTSLASDAHGNVFASVLENVVEGNPTTAEPHDVRQVWVATRVAGMAEGEISLKGSHGGYLSCDELGTLGARREARGFEENFTVEAIPSESRSDSNKGEWRLKTAASKKGQVKYVGAVMEGGGEEGEDEGTKKKVSISLRGDGEDGEKSTQIVIKMQARFKPRLQRDTEQKKSEKVSRAELERVVGRRLDEDEVKRLKRAKRDGTYHEEILDVRVKGKHDKFA